MKTDFLVVGSGLAGLYFALNASKYGKCCIITKGRISECNTQHAQGGIAAVVGKDDSFEEHIQDTLKAGAGLCSIKNVKLLVENGPREIQKLMSYGVKFDKKDNELELGREGAHSRRRILHNKDATGKEIESALIKAARNDGNISIKENAMLVELCVKNNECYGAVVLDLNKDVVYAIESAATILATGGMGQAYKHTTNPEVATGDGISAAFRAGAKINDMEFIQFHPTALNLGSGIKFLISEAVRGEGAHLLNSRGEKFVKHELKELAPRDILAREIFKEMENGDVFLDISHKDKKFVKLRFPNIYSECLNHGVDITNEKIPISPVAHFLCGGIKTDSYGRTSVKNLFAIGECACTGVHGANRLASNSLLECAVFASRASKKMKSAQHAKISFNKNYPDKYKLIELNSRNKDELMELQKQIKEVMWEKAGIVRTKKGLRDALGSIAELTRKVDEKCKHTVNKDILETQSLLVVSGLIIRASLKRRRSVGCFYLK